MNAAEKSTEDAAPSESLGEIKDRFARWREGRKRGEHIPLALWSAATRLVSQHGVQATALALRVNEDQLKTRIARLGGQTRMHASTAPLFVELLSSPASATGFTVPCIVEMENARGGKMRVELGDIAGLAGLASAFWSA